MSENEQALIELIRWRDSCIDSSGEELAARILATLKSVRHEQVPPQHHPALLQWRKLSSAEQINLVRRVLKGDEAPDNLGVYEYPQGRFVRMHRETYANLLAVVETARSYHEVNDDGHECPRDGAECDGCRLKDALKKLKEPT